MKKLLFILFLLSIIIVFFYENYNSNYISNSENNIDISSIVTYDKNLNIVNDLPFIEYPLDYQNDGKISFKEKTYSIDEIIKCIDENTNDFKDKMALYYYNFDTDEEYFFNEDTYFVAASLKKVPLVMQVLDKVYKCELSLNDEIKYIESSDYATGTGILQFEDNIGSRSIDELIKLSIIESDNIAYNMLNRVCGNTLTEYIENITSDYTANDDEYPKLTAKQNFEILYRLYKNPDNNPYYSTVIELMKETEFHDRLDKYIAYEKVSHKIGSYYRYYHDMGFIFAEETYLLVVLSKDIGELSNSPEFTPEQEERIVIDWGDEACEVIAVLSKSIFNIINR